MNKIEDIIDTLPSLNKKELEQIQIKIFFLLTDTKKGSRVDEEVFYNIISNELSRKLKKKQPPFHAFNRQSGYKNFKTVFESTIDYIESSFKGESMNRATRLNFYVIATKIVINDFDNSPIPLNLNTLITNFKNLPSLIDREFPGYSMSGLLPRIVKAKYMNKTIKKEED